MNTSLDSTILQKINYNFYLKTMRRLQVIYRTLYILLIVSLSGCSKEEDFSTYRVRMLNTSNSIITLSAPNRLDSSEVVELAVIMPGQFYDCTYTSDQFLSFLGCVSDNLSVRNAFQDLIMKFPNGKGYMCGTSQQSNLCFPDNRQSMKFDEDAFNRIENNILQITTTQQDFVNAFDLP